MGIVRAQVISTTRVTGSNKARYSIASTFVNGAVRFEAADKDVKIEKRRGEIRKEWKLCTLDNCEKRRAK